MDFICEKTAAKLLNMAWLEARPREFVSRNREIIYYYNPQLFILAIIMYTTRFFLTVVNRIQHMIQFKKLAFYELS